MKMLLHWHLVYAGNLAGPHNISKLYGTSTIKMPEVEHKTGMKVTSFPSSDYSSIIKVDQMEAMTSFTGRHSAEFHSAMPCTDTAKCVYFLLRLSPFWHSPQKSSEKNVNVIR